MQNSLFKEFIDTVRHTTLTGGQVRFSKAGFVKFLMRHATYKVGPSPVPPDREIDLELPEALAKVILNKAELNGYIKRDKGKSIDDLYVVNV